MRAIITILSLAVLATAQKSCYTGIDIACSKSGTKSIAELNEELALCNATYGLNILTSNATRNQLIDYANNYIVRSYEYLLMSVHFSNYVQNRPGFEKLFRQLSDAKWQTTIDIIKHITKRGGTMNFLPPRILDQEGKNKNFELYELQSLSKALDIEKQLAVQAFDIHNKVSSRHNGEHDPEIATYLEENFVEEQANEIRTLAGHVNDLSKMLASPDRSLALFLFDEYLQKA